MITINKFDPLMKKHEDIIESFAYVTPEIRNIIKYIGVENV